MTPTSHREQIPFFNDLPAKAVRPAAALWDYAQSANFNGAKAYSDFVSDLVAEGINPPARPIVKRWVSGVQVNLIARPGGAAPKIAKKADEIACRHGEVTGQTEDETETETPAASMTETVVSSPDVPAIRSKDERAARSADRTFQPLSPSDFKPAIAVMCPDEALGSVFEHLVDAAVEELQRDVRKQARQIAADRLHQMIDTMEAGNV